MLRSVVLLCRVMVAAWWQLRLCLWALIALGEIGHVVDIAHGHALYLGCVQEDRIHQHPGGHAWPSVGFLLRGRRACPAARAIRPAAAVMAQRIVHRQRRCCKTLRRPEARWPREW